MHKEGGADTEQRAVKLAETEVKVAEMKNYCKILPKIT